MGPLLRVLLVVAHVAATAFACPAPSADVPSPELARAYGANALHAHGSEPEGQELRAPCPCGCDEAPVAAQLSGPLGAALLPAPLAADLPRAVHFASAQMGDSLAPPRLPDPVPRLA
jgi:hypothetical protein